MILVSIHDFLPQKIAPNAANGIDEDGKVIDEKYIALTNGFNDNYKDVYQLQNSENDTTDAAVSLNNGALIE